MNLEEISAALNNEGLDYIFVAAKNKNITYYKSGRGRAFSYSIRAGDKGKRKPDLVLNDIDAPAKAIEKMLLKEMKNGRWAYALFHDNGFDYKLIMKRNKNNKWQLYDKVWKEFWED